MSQESAHEIAQAIIQLANTIGLLGGLYLAGKLAASLLRR